jgi:hypothetical protein
MILFSLPGHARRAVAAVLMVGIFSIATLPNVALATPITIALWTFQSPNIPTDSIGQSSGPWSPATGSGSASGFHTSASTAWSTPAGNGSADSFSSNNWAIGDYYQFEVATTGLSGLQMFWDQTRSSTGPSGFDLEYRVGSSGAFTQATSYVVPQVTWSTTTPANPPTTSFSFDLSGITALDNQAGVFFRLTATSAPSATGGTNRIDNVQITGVPEPSTVVLAAAGVGLAGFAARRRRLLQATA